MIMMTGLGTDRGRTAGDLRDPQHNRRTATAITREFGHIDGMLRFLDANTVLVSDFKRASYPNNFLSEFDQSLTRAGLETNEISLSGNSPGRI